MRQVVFHGDDRAEQELYAAMVVVFWQSAPAQSFEQLATASALKKKLNAISDALDESGVQRKLKEGEQSLVLRNTEWEYLRDHLTPPAARWPNSIADQAIMAIERIREADTVPDPK